MRPVHPLCHLYQISRHSICAPPSPERSVSISFCVAPGANLAKMNDDLLASVSSSFARLALKSPCALLDIVLVVALCFPHPIVRPAAVNNTTMIDVLICHLTTKLSRAPKPQSRDPILATFYEDSTASSVLPPKPRVCSDCRTIDIP